MLIKIPLSPYVAGMVMIGEPGVEDIWYTPGALLKAYSRKCSRTGFYTLKGDKEVKETTLFGVKLYQIGHNWSGRYFTPAPRFKDSLYLCNINYIIFDADIEQGTIRCLTPESALPQWVGVIKRFKSVLPFGMDGRVWYTREAYMKKNKIADKSTVYRQVHSGKILSLTFLNRKNSFFSENTK